MGRINERQFWNFETAMTHNICILVAALNLSTEKSGCQWSIRPNQSKSLNCLFESALSIIFVMSNILWYQVPVQKL
jgi:hypothetical protein